jgi:hypothetical protein
MDDADKTKFAEAFAVLAVVHDVEATPERVRAYWLSLSDLPTNDVLRAFSKAMNSLKFFPKPAEIRELAGGSHQDAALSAWSELCERIDSDGAYRSVLFSDGVLNAALRACGGWQYACGLSTGEFESFFRQRFISTYTSFREQGKTSHEPFVGITDQSNNRRPSGPRLLAELSQGVIGKTQHLIETRKKA